MDRCESQAASTPPHPVSHLLHLLTLHALAVSTQEVLRDMFQRDLAQGMRDQLLCTSSPLFSQEFGVVIASPGQKFPLHSPVLMLNPLDESAQ